MNKMNMFLAAACVLLFVYTGNAQEPNAQLKYVDPTIGGVGLLLQPTRPTMHLPNSMIRVYPVRKDQLDDQISYFPLTMYSHRIGNVFSIVPYTGDPSTAVWKKKFTYDLEKTTPYYYSVVWEDDRTQTEFSPAAHSGMFQFSFRTSEPKWIRFGLAGKEGEVKLEGRTITGTENFHGMKAYVYGELDTDPLAAETIYQNDSKQQLLIRLPDNSQGARFRYAISYISIAQAKENLSREVKSWSLSEVKNQAVAAWNNVMGQVEVSGGTEAEKRTFYTALYRTYERMVNISEYGQYYSAYDHRVHEDSRPFYVDNWIWDMYLADEPLHMILNPDKEADKISSYVRMYKQSGWMPSFALVFEDNPCMTGNHAAAWMEDAWVKGIRDFDLADAYEGLKKNSLEATLLPWRNGPATSLDRFYNKNGYMPALYPDEKEMVPGVHNFERRQSVAVTLQNSYDDWALAQMAARLGKTDDRDLFLKRAAYYKNVFRTDKGIMWPKDSAGNWIEPFDPKFSGGQGGRAYFTENNGYTYNWDVKHDLTGLFQLMGGKEKAEAKLDNLFRENLGRSQYEFWATFPDATGLVGQFSMGNEPSFHIPYLYNYLGAPWKTQKRIRMLMDTWFRDDLFSIPGDEDGGGMSAFVVFSMMGFYPVTPGIPVYNIGSPSFEKIVINLPTGKKFTVTAHNNSAENRYIQKASLNGVAWDKPWFEHNQLVNGGTLELFMDKQPNRTWGAADTAAPPSSLGAVVPMKHGRTE